MAIEMQAENNLALTEEDIRLIVRQEVERALRRDPAAKKACIIASKGTLDWAYPPLILGSAAAAAGMDAAVFFTFYGLNIIHRAYQRRGEGGPDGHTAMPAPLPRGHT